MTRLSNTGKRVQPSGGQKRGGKKSPVVLAVILIAAVLLAAAAVVWFLNRESAPQGAEPSGPGSGSASSASGEPDGSQGGEPENTGLAFPYVLEEGGVTVTSLFQSTIFNPDCGDAEGENIASLGFTNTTERHLARCEFTAVLTDGTQYHFLAEDIPAGQSASVFETDNAALDAAVPCESISCTAEFEAAAPVMADQIQVSVQGTQVTLTNIGGEDLPNLVVTCHCLLDGAVFGGTTYSYPMEALPAGETVTLSAEDCYLGEAAVVRIAPANVNE